MTVGFILTYVMSSSLFGLNQAMLGKSIEHCVQSRGVFLGVGAFCSSCSVILIDLLGGRLYETDKRNPFYICLSAELCILIMIIVLACIQKLHI